MIWIEDHPVLQEICREHGRIAAGPIPDAEAAALYTKRIDRLDEAELVEDERRLIKWLSRNRGLELPKKS